jgi:hypothetical protein
MVDGMYFQKKEKKENEEFNLTSIFFYRWYFWSCLVLELASSFSRGLDEISP